MISKILEIKCFMKFSFEPIGVKWKSYVLFGSWENLTLGNAF